MDNIPFGKTGLTVSELGFGGIPIIRLDEEAAVAVLRRAYESGITFYDTANAYRELIITAIEPIRDRRNEASW